MHAALLAVAVLALACILVPFIATVELNRRQKRGDDVEERMVRPRDHRGEQHQHGKSATSSSRQIEIVDDEVDSSDRGPLNVVLLYADDWSFRTLGAMERALRRTTNYGVPEFVRTPNIDELAEDGVLFTHNAVTTSTCSVSRATMYTGQYASVHRSPLPGDAAMFAEGRWNETLFPLLREKGDYRCGMVGKWHHAAPPGVHDTFEMWRAYFGKHYVERDGRVHHVTDLNERDAIEFLEDGRRGEGRFALLVSFFAIHAGE